MSTLYDSEITKILKAAYDQEKSRLDFNKLGKIDIAAVSANHTSGIAKYEGLRFHFYYEHLQKGWVISAA
jgi:DNA-binding SARP family transcriptional activator